MRYAWIDCPRCGDDSPFILGEEVDRHLRRCANCQGWLVVHERPTENPATVDVQRVEPLGTPPTCPVDGCGETLRRIEPPRHVLEQHGGSLG